MIYIDASLFVFAALNTENVGDEARSLLRDVQTGKLEANSSALTFDELVWAVRGAELPRMQSPLGRHS